MALLAAEAVSLVVRACSRRAGMQALGELGGGEPRLLVAAAGRCGQVGALDRRVQIQAARLLDRTARRLREDSDLEQTTRAGGRNGATQPRAADQPPAERAS